MPSGKRFIFHRGNTVIIPSPHSSISFIIMKFLLVEIPEISTGFYALDVNSKTSALGNFFKS